VRCRLPMPPNPILPSFIFRIVSVRRGGVKDFFQKFSLDIAPQREYGSQV
jgi:hypothetical protein